MKQVGYGGFRDSGPTKCDNFSTSKFGQTFNCQEMIEQGYQCVKDNAGKANTTKINPFSNLYNEVENRIPMSNMSSDGIIMTLSFDKLEQSFRH